MKELLDELEQLIRDDELNATIAETKTKIIRLYLHAPAEYKREQESYTKAIAKVRAKREKLEREAN